MNNYIIVTDSCCDLTDAMATKLGLTVIPLTVNVSGSEYRNLLDGSDISFSDIYSRLRAGEMATTSAVNIETFRQTMTPLLEGGYDVIYIGFSGALSNTVQAGFSACRELQEEYPDRKLYAVDSRCASLGQGLLVYLACKRRDEGATIDELYAYVNDILLNICHWFTVDDLHFLHRGGRVSKTVAVVGSMLNIKPVLHVDNEGRLISVSKARGRRASLDALVANMEKTAIDPKTQTVFISHGDCIDDAKYVAEQVRKKLGTKEFEINYVGPVIGSHSGPGTVALFFVGTER